MEAGTAEGASAVVELQQSQEAPAGLLVWSVYQNISWSTEEQRETLDFPPLLTASSRVLLNTEYALNTAC